MVRTFTPQQQLNNQNNNNNDQNSNNNNNQNSDDCSSRTSSNHNINKNSIIYQNKGFYRNFQKICKNKNLHTEIFEKIKEHLDFYIDRTKLDEWLAIINSLRKDEHLQFIGIRRRQKCSDSNFYVLENIVNESKARKIRDRPVAFTKFIYESLMESLIECLQNNCIVHTLILEGLPLNEKYSTCIGKALSQNNSLKIISFEYSIFYGSQHQHNHHPSIEILCSTLKYLPNIEYINFSNCRLTSHDMESIGDLIKYQKIFRCSEGWMKSLRYQDFNPNSIAGLLRINLNNNTNIGDVGLQILCDILKDDLWIKVLEMQNCGITDSGANHIIDCLNYNKSLSVFDIKRNNKISENVYQIIRARLGYDDAADCGSDSTDDMNKESMKLLTPSKNHILKLKDKLRFCEQKLEIEINNRKHVEQLNEQLYLQMMKLREELESNKNSECSADETIKTLQINKDLATFANYKKIKRTKSENHSRKIKNRNRMITKSACTVQQSPPIMGVTAAYINKKSEKLHIETNIGDSLDVNRNNNKSIGNYFCGLDVLNELSTSSKRGAFNQSNNRFDQSVITPKLLFMGKKI